MARFRDAGAIVASIARGAAICAVSLLCVFAYTAGSLRRLAIRDPRARADHRARQRGVLFRWCFSRLGATFIKVGQVMSSRADLLSPPVIDELRELQDHVRPFSFARVRTILERELGRPLSSVFIALDRTPLAAGGIAQVHRGLLRTGEEVAVKVLRPHVRARVHRDARLMLWLAHVASFLSRRARAADVIGHARSLVSGIIVQTDLAREAENLDRFGADFADTPGLAFPRVIRHLSRGAVLTMSLVRGVHLDQVPREHVARVTGVLRDAFFAMCFEHGLVHADLHPGNILVGADGTVFILDVGLVKYLDAMAISRLVELSRALVLGTPDELVTHLRDHHPHDPTTDWDAVASDAGSLIARLRRTSIAELEVSQVVADLFSLARKHGIHPLPELSLVLLGMVTIEGIAKRLDPNANTLAEIARYLAPRIAHTGLARGSREWAHPPLGVRTECDAPTTAPPSLRVSRSDPHPIDGTRDAPDPTMARRSE